MSKRHSKPITVTDYLHLQDNNTTEDVYKILKYMKLNPRYDHGWTEYDWWNNIDFVYLGNVYTIKFTNKGKNGQIKRIDVRIRDGMWPAQDLNIYKRHWWY